MPMEVEIIHLYWEGPLSFEEVRRRKDSPDKGVYQLCGSHPAYGNRALLYIGKTMGKTGSQTFSRRVPRKSYELWEQDSGKHTAYLGRIHDGPQLESRDWERKIDIAERLLILAHKPSHNTAGLFDRRRKPEIQRVLVLNWGDRGCLLPEVSGARWSALFDDIQEHAANGNHSTAP